MILEKSLSRGRDIGGIHGKRRKGIRKLPGNPPGLKYWFIKDHTILIISTYKKASRQKGGEGKGGQY